MAQTSHTRNVDLPFVLTLKSVNVVHSPHDAGVENSVRKLEFM